MNHANPNICPVRIDHGLGLIRGLFALRGLVNRLYKVVGIHQVANSPLGNVVRDGVGGWERGDRSGGGGGRRWLQGFLQAVCGNQCVCVDA